MTTWEFSIRTIARVSRRLGLSFTKAQAVENARDKFLCRQVLALENVPSARCALAADIHTALEAAGDIGYPVIAKPVAPPPREFPHAAISRCVAVTEDGAIPPDYDLSWLEEYRGDLLLFDLPICPGQKVRKLESSEEIFGFMQLKAPDARSGQERAEEIIQRLGRSLGLTMAA